MNCKLEKKSKKFKQAKPKTKTKKTTTKQNNNTKPKQTIGALPDSADSLSWGAFHLWKKKDPTRKQKQEEQCKGKDSD